MSAASEVPLPFHPALERIRRFRLMYAVAVNAVAAVIVVAFLVSLRVREFRTIGQIEVAPVAGSTLTESEAGSLVTRSIRSAASDQLLQKILAQSISTAENAATPAWTGEQLARVRNSLAFSIVPNPEGQALRVTVAVSGRGSLAETRLVQAFLGTLADQLAQPSGGGTAQLELLTQSQYEALRSRQDAALVSANQHLQAMNTQIVKLANDTVQLARKAEALAAKPEAGLTEEAGLKGRIANPFQAASFEHKPETEEGVLTADLARDRFAGIPLSELSQSFSEIEKGWDATFIPLETVLANSTPTCETKSDLRAVARSQTRQVPFGLQPPREWLLLTICGAMALGCFLAAGVDMRSHDPGLGSPEEIEKSLQIPILGLARSEKAPGTTFRRRWSLRILKLNELVVFTTLLTILIVCFSAPEIRQALIENPLHAFARILWSIRAVG